MEINLKYGLILFCLWLDFDIQWILQPIQWAYSEIPGDTEYLTFQVCHWFKNVKVKHKGFLRVKKWKVCSLCILFFIKLL